jgi:NADH pyrophosphatase NudC (nudix superfamily)
LGEWWNGLHNRLKICPAKTVVGSNPTSPTKKIMAEQKFIPKKGQIDFTNVRYCPVVNTIVTHDGKTLLVQRSDSMRLYPSYWNGISGFLDDSKSINEKVYEELSEELGIAQSNVQSLQIGQVLLQEAPEYHKTWLVVPVLAKVTSPDFKLDWEASQAKWFTVDEIKKLKLLPGFEEVIEQFSI